MTYVKHPQASTLEAIAAGVQVGRNNPKTLEWEDYTASEALKAIAEGVIMWPRPGHYKPYPIVGGWHHFPKNLQHPDGRNLLTRAAELERKGFPVEAEVYFAIGSKLLACPPHFFEITLQN